MSKDVSVTLSARVGQYIAAMQQASAATKAVSASGVDIQKLGGTLQSVGRTATLGLTAPLVAAGGASVALANRFGQTFTRMGTLAQVPTQALGQMRESVLALSRETGRGPQEIADALYNAASSGLTAEQALDAVGIAAKAAASGLGNTGDVISLVASATASYGATNMDAARATDILIGTIREGSADPDELAGSLGRILPVAASLGVSFEEVGGATAVLSNTFQHTGRTVTSMSGILNKLSAPTIQGREALQRYGSSMENLRRIIAEDGLIGALEHLQSIGLTDDPLAFRAMFDDVDALAGAQALVAQLDNLKGAVEGVRGSSGALGEIFSAAQGDDGFRMAQSIARVQAALIEFGDAIGPAVAGAAEGIAQIATAFSSLPDAVQIAIAGALIAVGPLTTLAGTVTKNAATIRAGLAIITGSSASAGLGGAGAAAGAGLAGGAAAAAGTVALAAAIVGIGAYAGYQGFDALMGGGATDRSPAEARQRRQTSQADRDRFFGPSVPAGYRAGDDALTRLLGPSVPSGQSRGPLDRGPASPWGQMASRGLASLGSANELAANTAQIQQMTAAAQEYQRVVASSDWGAASLAGASAAMSSFNSYLFGGHASVASMEGAMDGLASALQEVGTVGAGGLNDLNLKTEEGRAAFQALQQVAGAWEPTLSQAVSAAGGNVEVLQGSLGGIREDFIAMAMDAGISRGEAESLASAIGLIPENAQTLIELAGDEEAKVRLGLLQGVLGSLQADVQREVAMRIATGDFQGALDLVQANIDDTPTSHTTNFYGRDGVSGVVANIRSQLATLHDKTIRITTIRVGGSTSYTTGAPSASRQGGSAWTYNAMGGYYDTATTGVFGEAGPEVILPLSRPSRLRELLSDARVLTPITAAMGGGRGGGGVAPTVNVAAPQVPFGAIASTVGAAVSAALRAESRSIAAAVRAGRRFD